MHWAFFSFFLKNLTKAQAVAACILLVIVVVSQIYLKNEVITSCHRDLHW